MSYDFDQDVSEDQANQSALDFALGSPATIPEEARSADRVLEVYQIIGTAVHSAQQFASGQTVRIGSGLERPYPALIAPADSLPFDNLTLFESVPGVNGPTWALRFHPTWNGLLRRGGEEHPLGTLLHAGMASREPDGLIRLELRADDRVQLQIENICVIASPVRPARPVPAARPGQGDPARTGIFGFILATFAILATALGTIPSAPAATFNDQNDARRLVQLRLPPPAPPPSPFLPKQAKAAASGTEGRSHAPTPQRGVHKTINPRESGLLAALNNGMLHDVLGSGRLSEDLMRGVGGLIGGHATGGPGLAERGDGLGGGGKIGSAEYGVNRTSGCATADCGTGFNNSGHVKADGKIDVGGGPIIMGPINKQQIDEVVRRHLAEVRYCYQRELQRRPGLAGKVSVKFVIAADGSVSSAQTDNSSLGASAVESCINTRFMRMQFPALRGGSIAIVRYPFLFSPG